VVGSSFALITPVQAAELTALAASASAPALKALAPRFEHNTGHTLKIEYGILDGLKAKINSEATFDLLVLPKGLIEPATKKKKIDPDTQAMVARVGMALAVKAGAPKPDISSVEAFKQTLLNAKSITYPPKGLIGNHLTKVFETLGISEEMQGRIKPLKTVELVPPTLASGTAELGFAPSTLLSAAKGIDVVGPLPVDLQSYVVLVAAVGSKAKDPEAVKAFIKYLKSPDAVGAMKAKGFEVGMR